MSNVRVLPEDLQNGFAGVRIVGSLREDLEEWRESWLRADNSLRSNKSKLDLSVDKSPVMMCTNHVKDFYTNSTSVRYGDIESLEKVMADDLKKIDDDVRAKGIDAFDKVEKEGKTYYLAHTSRGAIWIYNYKTEQQFTSDENGDRNTTYVNYFQVGKYSANGRVAGTVDYIFKGASFVVGAILSAMVGKMLQTILAQGTKLVLDYLVNVLIGFAAENGLSVQIGILVGGASTLVGAIVFVLVFVGLEAFWNWANRKYTIKLCYYNWSTEHDLSISDCYCDNTDMICKAQHDENRCRTIIPKMVPAGGQITPPGFDPPTTLDNICYYATYFFENTSTFFEGCGTSMKVEIGKRGSDKGFYYAFECPRFAGNRYQLSSRLDFYKSPEDFYIRGHWRLRENDAWYTVEGTRIHVSVDAFTGNNSYYRPIVSFNA